MKKNTHPKYYPKAKVICVCGKIFEIGSTQEEIKVELCSACHPFYTGKQKLIDTAGRVEKFKAKSKAKETISKTRSTKTVKQAKKDKKRSERKISLKDIKKEIEKETKK